MLKKRKRLNGKNQDFQQSLLRWVNIRPDEASRTFLMFAFYTVSYIGILWLEISAAALFIGEYGANTLPWIYIASAVMGTGFGVFYSMLQRFLPLRSVIVITPIFLATPLLFFGLGFNLFFLGAYSVFFMRLWLDALYTLTELNTSIASNQLFNIREIKRSYPFISSGILVADVVSGFSLPLLRQLIGLENIIFLSSIMLLLGAGILMVVITFYPQAFPKLSQRYTPPERPNFATRRLQGPLRRYVVLVITFFVMSQILLIQLDFQYLSQVEQTLDTSQGSVADFLAIFSGLLGIVELLTQWFVSSRVVERMGVFVIAMLPPILMIVIGGLSLSGIVSLFIGVATLKFVDDWLRYTVIAGTSPIFFQPIPDHAQGRIQEWVRGIAEPISMGITGGSILISIWLCQRWVPGPEEAVQFWQNRVFIGEIVIAAGIWLAAVVLLRSRYLNLLVLSAENGQLTLSANDLDSRTFRRAVIEALEQEGNQGDKRQYIQLLASIDPKGAAGVLASLLHRLSPALQRQSLKVMLEYPNRDSFPHVQSLLEEEKAPPDIFAMALRYIWLSEGEHSIDELRPYLSGDVDAAIRGTAAALMLQKGNTREKAEATNVLRRMLTNQSQERERLMGCRALENAVYLQALRLYIPSLLKDPSLRVRCAVLEAIASTRLEEYYPSIVRALYYSSTRDAAVQALARLGSEAIPMLIDLAEDSHRPQVVRASAWVATSSIGTEESLDVLVNHLMSSWGADRRSLLRILLNADDEDGIDAVAEALGRRGVEDLIDQELSLIGQAYAALADITPAQEVTQEMGLLRRTLRYQQQDAIDRLFLLMRFLYPSSTIQAASFNIKAESSDSVARGLEILDNTIDLPKKQIVLNILDPQLSDLEKLQLLSDIVSYQPMSPSRRLRYLLDLRQFLSDWTIACCFHLARRSRWSVTIDHVLAGLHHEVNFVREAALMYLYTASPNVLADLLPILKHDPDPAIALQVDDMQAMLKASGISNINPSGSTGTNGRSHNPSPS
ncbi:MAG: HEAT repeat domain-containing protein [Elainellaceae cyanobacterium]